MARLTVSAPKLPATSRKLSGSSALARTTAPWRAWYQTAEWRALRKRVFIRDGFTCQGCRRICTGRHPSDDSPVADHVEAHRGDRARFFDEANVQTLCKSPCHDKAKQAEEQATRHQIGVWD